jgi:hypothetical protein
MAAITVKVFTGTTPTRNYEAGDTITIWAWVYNVSDALHDPATSIKLTYLYDPDGTKQVDNVNMTKDDTGKYYYSYVSAASAVSGWWNFLVTAVDVSNTAESYGGFFIYGLDAPSVSTPTALSSLLDAITELSDDVAAMQPQLGFMGFLGDGVCVASSLPSTYLVMAEYLRNNGYYVDVCDGTADDVQINALLTLLSANKLLKLTHGTFNATNQIVIPTQTSFLGEQMIGTVINAPSGISAIKVQGISYAYGNHIGEFRVVCSDAAAINAIKLAQCLFERITIGSVPASSGMYVNTECLYSTFRDIAITGVATDNNSCGFMAYGTFNSNLLERVGTSGLQYGITFIDAASNKVVGGSSEGNQIGIRVRYGTQELNIDNEYFEANEIADIKIWGESEQAVIKGIVIQNCYFNGTGTGDYAILIGSDADDKVDFIIIKHNEFKNHTGAAIKVDPTHIKPGTVIIEKDNDFSGETTSFDDTGNIITHGTSRIQHHAVGYPDTSSVLSPNVSGSTHTNLGSSASIELSLGSGTWIQQGRFYTFCVMVAHKLDIAPGGSSHCFYINGAKQANGKDIYSEAIGDSVTVMQDEAGDWVATNVTGTWSVET